MMYIDSIPCRRALGQDGLEQDMEHLTRIPESNIPGHPTVVLKGTALRDAYSAAIGTQLGTILMLDGKDEAGASGTKAALGALLINCDASGGDIEIVIHTRKGLESLATALGIPLTHRVPYTSSFEDGPGPSFSESLSKTAKACSGAACASNTA